MLAGARGGGTPPPLDDLLAPSHEYAHTKLCLLLLLQVLWVGGLGNKTYFPPWITRFPQDTTMASAKKEFDMVVLETCK